MRPRQSLSFQRHRQESRHQFLLESHDELDRVKGIGAKVFHEIGAVDNFVGIDAEVLDHNFFTRSATSLMVV